MTDPAAVRDAQAWLEQMADTWLADPETPPDYPPGVRSAGWGLVLRSLAEARSFRRLKTPDEVAFYAILTDGREIQTRRKWNPGISAARPLWQPREPMCPDEAAAGLKTQNAKLLSLVDEALHICTNGEYAPGGNENWTDWGRKTEAFLRSLHQNGGDDRG